MPESKSANVVRAIAVVGPTGAGKTALIQALASAASGGAGTAPAAAGQSTETQFTAIDFMGDHYALIDAPGAVDFLADADFALPAVDLAIVVADPDPDKAVLVQPFLKALEELQIPRALFINKIDQRARPHPRSARSAAAGFRRRRWSRARFRSGRMRRSPASSISRSNAPIATSRASRRRSSKSRRIWPSAKPKRASTCSNSSPISTTS